MERISKAIASPQPQKTGGMSLTTRSGPQLPLESVRELGMLLVQAQAAFPNQVLTTETASVFLKFWEDAALKWGMDSFTEGLSKAIAEAEFFPTIKNVREHVSEAYRAKHAGDMVRQMREERAAAEADRMAHPEEYCSVRDAWKEVIDRHQAKTMDQPSHEN